MAHTDPAPKALTKGELARMAGVSDRTMRRWLSRHSKQLEALGVRPKDHLLTPKATRWVCEVLGIDYEQCLHQSRPNDHL